MSQPSLTAQLLVIACLSFGPQYIAEWPQQAAVVEPRHIHSSLPVPLLHVFPRSTAIDRLGLVEHVDGLDQDVIMAVTLTAQRRFYAKPL